MRGKAIPCALLATHALACTHTNVLVHVPAPELRTAIRELDTRPTATVHDEQGESHAITKQSDVVVILDDGKWHDASLFTHLDACALSSNACVLRDPHAQFRLSVQKTRADTDTLAAIGFASLGVIALGGIGTLIAGNFACFSGPCDDGWKATVITGDIVVSALFIVAGAVMLYGIGHILTHWAN